MRKFALATALIFTAIPAQAQDLGVPACDAFIKTFESCVKAKAAPANQAAMTTALDQVKANWKAVAATPEGRKSLEPVCQQTAGQMKQQVAGLKCDW